MDLIVTKLRINSYTGFFIFLLIASILAFGLRLGLEYIPEEVSENEPKTNTADIVEIAQSSPEFLPVILAIPIGATIFAFIAWKFRHHDNGGDMWRTKKQL